MLNCSYKNEMDPTKEQYDVDVCDVGQLGIKITLFTTVESEARPDNLWQGVLEVNGKAVERWHGPTCASVAETAEGKVAQIHMDCGTVLGVV